MKMINNKTTVLVTAVAVAGLSLFMTACSSEEAVSFSKSVKPLLEANCQSCHKPGGEGHAASGFSVETYDALMKGTQFGPMVIAGDSEGSNLVVLMEGRADPSISMPHGDMKPIASKDIALIRKWIDQGAKNN